MRGPGHYICILALLTFGASLVAAQTGDLPVDDLRTPTSPAFVLAGAAPSSIEKPETPQALFSTLVGGFTGTTLETKAMALEFAPYWFGDRSRLTFEQYYRPEFWTGLAQSASVSFLFTPKADGSASAALGLRTIVFSGAEEAAIKAVKSDYLASATWLLILDRLKTEAESFTTAASFQSGLDAAIKDYALPLDPKTPSVLSDSKTRLEKTVTELASKPGLDQTQVPAAIVRAVDAELSWCRTRASSIGSLWQLDQLKRSGLVLELAGACQVLTQSGGGGTVVFDRGGAWLTAMLRSGPSDALLSLRWVYAALPSATSFFDAGTRFILSFGQFSVSGEALLRTDFATLWYRIAVEARQPLSPGLTLDLGLAKNFGDPTDSLGGKISMTLAFILSDGKKLSLPL